MNLSTVCFFPNHRSGEQAGNTTENVRIRGLAPLANHMPQLSWELENSHKFAERFITNCENSFLYSITSLITHWEKLLDSDMLRDCEFILKGKLQISRAKICNSF